MRDKADRAGDVSAVIRNRIMHVSSVHNPFDTRIYYKECLSLAAEGFEVVLVAPATTDIVRDGVQIRAISGSSNRLRRVLVSSWQALRIAFSERADLYHFHDPELIPVALFLRLVQKTVVYDSHESLRKQIASKHWIPVWLRPLVGIAAEWMEKLAVVSLNGVVAATPAIARDFSSTKTTVVQNFPRLEEIKAGEAEHAFREAILVYIGGLRTDRGIHEMVEAINLLPPSAAVTLELGGTFSPRHLEDRVSALPGWSKVKHQGWVDRETVVEMLQRARIGLSLLHPEPNFLEAQPTKIFEYMAAGIPVLASNFPHYERIVGDSECGLLVDPLDPYGIAGVIQWLLAHPEEAEQMGRNGRMAVREKYNWDREARQLIALYDRVLGDDR